MGFYILTLTEWLSAVASGPHNGGSRAAAERASRSMMFSDRTSRSAAVPRRGGSGRGVGRASDGAGRGE